MKRFFERFKYFGLRKAYYSVQRLRIAAEDAFADTGLLGPPAMTNRRLSRTLLSAYNADPGHNTDNNKLFIGFGLIHYALIRNLKPSRVLCVGSRQGFIPAVLALACKDNGKGTVDFVDAGYDDSTPEKHWGGIGFWRSRDAKKHFATIGASEFINTYVMTTKQFAAAYPGRRYGYVYIDGDHSYRGVSLDFALFFPKLIRGGFMAFHDVVAKGKLDKGVFGVNAFWDKHKHRNAITLPFPKDSGLGILQKT